jgi:hypothetical protein
VHNPSGSQIFRRIFARSSTSVGGAQRAAHRPETAGRLAERAGPWLLPGSVTQGKQQVILPDMVSARTVPAFQLPPPLAGGGRRKVPASPRPAARLTACAAQPSASVANLPEVATPFGLAPSPGKTGTLGANLFPLPILGDYGWILNCWRLREEGGGEAVTARISEAADRVSLAFDRDARLAADAPAITGIVTGDYNVRSACQRIASPGDTMLTFFDRRDMPLKTQVSIVPAASAAGDSFWTAPALTFLDVTSVGDETFAVRDVRPLRRSRGQYPTG